MNILKKQLFSLFFIIGSVIALPVFGTEVSEKEKISEQTEVVVRTPWYKTPKARYALIITAATAGIMVILFNRYFNYLQSIIDTEFETTIARPKTYEMFKTFKEKQAAGSFASEEEAFIAYKEFLKNSDAIGRAPRLTMQEFFAKLKTLGVSGFFKEMKKVFKLA